MDELRQLLMREPRGHGAMSGAILQPPARPDADWGVIYIEVSGLPADVRARHDRRGHRAGRDRHGRGHRARDRDPARRPRRAWSRRACAVRARPRAVGDDPQRRRRSCTRATASSPSPASARSPTTWPTAATSTRSRPRPTPAWSSTRRARGELIEAGLAMMDAINAADRPVHPEDPRIARLPPRRLPRAGPRRRRRRGRDVDPPGLAGPLAVRDGHLARGWPSCTPAASSRLGEPFVNESVIGTRFTGRVVEETTVAGRAGGHPGDHRPGLDHRDGPVPARRRGPVPGGVLAVGAIPRGPRAVSAQSRGLNVADRIERTSLRYAPRGYARAR